MQTVKHCSLHIPLLLDDKAVCNNAILCMIRSLQTLRELHLLKHDSQPKEETIPDPWHFP